ncbi:hypothetical protein DdX_11983 [Ditylenchus destructor]|uniref:Uncharacterized protein n=1 Tax=Ditylenchus destructor TaxID=166010 RepID=A0AAD4MXB5_9BILA|nr:hypothetical protein DdX_11983 [Ditylenchus destructor]
MRKDEKVRLWEKCNSGAIDDYCYAERNDACDQQSAPSSCRIIAGTHLRAIRIASLHSMIAFREALIQMLHSQIHDSYFAFV